MKKFFLLAIAVLLSLNIFSQENETVLMTIDGRDITCEEFVRVYSKNNNITPETEKKSIDDYVNLFVNFKLKVIEAENNGYDTVKSFKTELEGYKNQLALPYIQSQKLKDDLILEAYARSTREVRASHIMVRLAENAPPADTLKAFQKIMAIYARLMAGEPFEEVAKASSDDRSAATNGGDLGYFSAFRMVYPFETVAYKTPVGQISMPVRTSFGYHIVKVTDNRPSFGSIRIAHILTRVAKDATDPEKQAAKEKIEKAYKELNSGVSWNDVVQKYSENTRTLSKNGEIGWIQRGQAPDSFLDEIVKLDTGQYSNIIEVPGGYHIVKILEKKPVESFDLSKDNISKKIDVDKERLVAIKNTLYSELEHKYGLAVNMNNASVLAPMFDSSIFEKKWNPIVAVNMNEPVIIVGNKSFSQYDYAIFLSKINRSKFINLSYNDIIEVNLKPFSEECLMNYAVEVLPNENLEYKYLYNEYHDGILLFNLTNDLVWKKAQDDTLGLEAFYKTAKKYSWDKRIDVTIYEYTNNDFTAKLPALAAKQAKNNLDIKAIYAVLCPNDSVPCVIMKEKTYENSQDALADKLTWKKGSTTVLTENGKNYLYYVKNIRKPQEKQLNDARGLYIADYQNKLEDDWIKQLRSKYVVTINESVLNDLKTKLNSAN